MVAVKDKVSVFIGSRFSLEFRCRKDRCMRCRHREIQEERLFLVFFDLLKDFIRQFIQHMLMMKVFSGRAFSPVFLSFSYRLPIRKLCKAVVLNINIGRHIQRSADPKEIVKTICHRGILDRRTVIHSLAGIKIRQFRKLQRFREIHSQVPFAYHCRMIALLPEEVRYCFSSFLQKWLRISPHHRGFQS